jgi:hypothetical protein
MAMEFAGRVHSQVAMLDRMDRMGAGSQREADGLDINRAFFYSFNPLIRSFFHSSILPFFYHSSLSPSMPNKQPVDVWRRALRH